MGVRLLPGKGGCTRRELACELGRFGPGAAKVSSLNVFEQAQVADLDAFDRKPSNAPRAFASPRASAAETVSEGGALAE